MTLDIPSPLVFTDKSKAHPWESTLTPTPTLKMSKKIYIAGKVTGLPPADVQAKFNNMASMLRLLGYIPINPIEVVNNPEAEWIDAMKVCISALIQCDAVYTLNCAAKSKGAIAETTLAKHLSMPVFDNLTDLNQWNNSQLTP